MKRLHDRKIDDAKYYEEVWGTETNVRQYYDAVRQRALAARVKDGDVVVDLGAGCFGAAQHLAEHTHLRVKLIAVDQSYTARDYVLARLANQPLACLSFEYILAPAERTPLPDASCDVVIAGELIEHFEDPAELAREMGRLCKPNGWIALSTVDNHCANAQQREYPEHLWEFEANDLLALFEPYGAARYGMVGDYHFLECRRI